MAALDLDKTRQKAVEVIHIDMLYDTPQNSKHPRHMIQAIGKAILNDCMKVMICNSDVS